MLDDRFFTIALPIILFTLVLGIISVRKRKQDINKVLAGKKCLREFEFRIMAAYSDTDIKLSFLSKYAPPTYDVFLFDDYIAFTTGLVMGLGESIPNEIELKDINFAKMKNIFQTDLLVVNYIKPEDGSEAQEASQLYIEGRKEELLFIKNFIEERIQRPKIVDLTGEDQTE